MPENNIESASAVTATSTVSPPKNLVRRAFKAAKHRLNGIVCKAHLLKKWIGNALRRGYALFWQRIYRAQYRVALWKARFGYLALMAFLVLLVGSSALLTPVLQVAIEQGLPASDTVATFKTLFVAVGSALIGAAVIAISFVMYAMQVNVERMPHGLFRKFSSDGKLLAAFAGAFVIAIVIAILSLIPNKSWLAAATLTTIWGTVLMLVLFLYAYRRALRLINPNEQLALVIADVQRDLQAWSTRARRAAPLITPSNQEAQPPGSLQSSHDIARATFFQVNAHWTAFARRAILHCVSYTRRYAERGDYEVSDAALNAIIFIQIAYVKTKGKTFFTNHLIMDNPLSTDGFINDTLEHLRQNVQIGISRGDEQQIEQTFQAMAALSRVYLNIDYASDHASKFHAHLASGYLSDAVQSIIAHNMPDVLMEGVRLMGSLAQRFIACGETNYVATLSEKIALMSCTGVAKENYRPVTQVGVEQLARITFGLIRSQASDVHFILGEVRGDVRLLAKTLLALLPDRPLMSVHSASLAPYYSGSTAALQGWLTDLTNALVSANADDQTAQRVIHHIEQWSDELHDSQKELFLAAIEKRSHFTLDMIHWITHTTKLLLALSNAPACRDHTRDKLRKNALYLVSVLSWVPDDKEAVTFVGNFQLAEILLDAALDAEGRDCDNVATEICGMLFSWAFNAGRHETGWGILDEALSALAALELRRGGDGTSLLGKISARLAKPDPPDHQARRRAAREIRETAEVQHGHEYSLSRIDRAMGAVDQAALRQLLIAIADRLSPLSDAGGIVPAPDA